ncbi:hypothetical protein LXA43DRAFT_330524 [Ganoderma leucocontextum]|nr:hypothetical protein LXA43DRAFT_330524 [Ganoderma leucocontextum]
MCPTLVLLRPLATPALALAGFDSLVHRRRCCPGLGLSWAAIVISVQLRYVVAAGTSGVVTFVASSYGARTPDCIIWSLSRIIAPQLPQLTLATPSSVMLKVRSFKSRCTFKLVSSPHCPVHGHHHC